MQVLVLLRVLHLPILRQKNLLRVAVLCLQQNHLLMQWVLCPQQNHSNR